MQNPISGELEPISGRRHFEERAKAAAGGRHVCTFAKNEVLEIRGGRFRVRSIGRKAIVFESLPGVDIRSRPPEPEPSALLLGELDRRAALEDTILEIDNATERLVAIREAAKLEGVGLK